MGTFGSMSLSSKDTLSLKVLEVYTRDVGRGVARIDYDSMVSLNDPWIGSQYSSHREPNVYDTIHAKRDEF